MTKIILAICFINFIACKSNVRHKGTDNKPSAELKDKLKEAVLRIINGEDVTEGEYPYAVILVADITVYNETDGEHHRLPRRHCTASMLTAHWALTAGHCVDYYNGLTFSIWYKNFATPLLAMQSESAEVRVNVAQIVIHPGFILSRKVITNDIALLRADKRIDIKTYGRLLSVDYRALIGLPVVYLGGGKTKEDLYPDDQVKPMQIGEGVISTCSKEKFGYLKLHPMFCVSSKCSNRKLSVRTGDDGGPLIHDGYIIGVASVSLTVAREGGIFTPVSPFLDWISDVIRSNHKNEDIVDLQL